MNESLKLKAAGAGVKLWQVAKEMGIADATLSRKMRTEFSNEDREQFLAAVDKLAAEKGRRNG